jgi:hypothetical protein
MLRTMSYVCDTRDPYGYFSSTLSGTERFQYRSYEFHKEEELLRS